MIPILPFLPRNPLQPGSKGGKRAEGLKKRIPASSCILLVRFLAVSWVFAFSFCPAFPGEMSSVAQSPPKGLTESDWASIRAAYDEGRHAFFEQKNGHFVARNPGQRWLTEFDGKGFLTRPDGGGWKWGLTLREYSVGGARFTVCNEARGEAKGKRLSYDRGAGMTEWFVNDGRGLEQGWTIEKRSATAITEVVRLELGVLGGLKPSVTPHSVAFVDDQGATALTYGGLKAWDATGKNLAVRFVEGKAPESISLEVAAEGAVFPVVIDPIAQAAYVKASQPETSEGFGNAVAISGDTVVVGAPNEDSGAKGVNGNQASTSAENSGAAYVFVRKGNQWSQQAYLKASNTESFDFFGSGVTVSGNTIVVGAYGEDSIFRGINRGQRNNEATFAGAVYVFVRTGSTWRQQTYIKASNTRRDAFFGADLALAGNTLVVGSYGEASSATGINGNQNAIGAFYSGAAYVFTRTGSTWRQQAYLKASNAEQSDHFGTSVAISGDTVVVGAYREESDATGVGGDQNNNNAIRSGAAYVFVRNASEWQQQAFLKASNTGDVDYFGTTVSISGNVIVVGAPEEDSDAVGVNGDQNNDDAENSGAAYVFRRLGSQWTQEAFLKASNTDTDDEFGSAVSISGDTIVVGAPFESSSGTGIGGNQTNSGATESGAAYVFRRGSGLWSQQAYLKSSNSEARDSFGRALSISGDTIVVSANQEDSASVGVNGDESNNDLENSGAVYIFDGFGPTFDAFSRKGEPVPGETDLNFTQVFQTAINESGRVMFDHGLSGREASRSRNRAIFSTLAGGQDADLALQRGDEVSGFVGAGYQVGNRVNGMRAIVTNQSAAGGLIDAQLVGPGLNGTNNRAIIRDDGSSLSLVFRTGVLVGALGGATPRLVQEVNQHFTQDLLAVNYLLRPSRPDGVNRTNDSGFLLLNHAGVVQSANPREGQPSFPGTPGTFGQFQGRVALAEGGNAFFINKFRPDGDTPKDAMFLTDGTGFLEAKYGPSQGDPAPGTFSGELMRSYLAINERGSVSLLRATLSKSPRSKNEGVWNCGSLLLLRKGETDLGGGVVARRILRYWPVGASQTIFHLQLAGPGVNGRNNQALILRQANGEFLTLLRTGDPAPGVEISGVTVATIQAVEVNRINGHYAILGGLRGAPASTNQALWTGQASLGDDSILNQPLRLPVHRLQKGDNYRSSLTERDQIRGLILKTTPDRTGTGSRGLAQSVGVNGDVIVSIMGDRRAQELVRLGPYQ